MTFEDPTKVNLEGTPDEVPSAEDPLDNASTIKSDPLDSASTIKVEVPPETI